MRRGQDDCSPVSVLQSRHGSVFLRNGDNIAGPAPVPLYRAAIALDLNGNLVVNKSEQENRPGERDRFPFFLPLSHDAKPVA